MVATTILLIIILMVGRVFRGASSAWDAGYANAEGGMIVRGVVGAIQRELSAAEDGRFFDGVWNIPHPVDVSTHRIKFVMLKESSGSATTSSPPKREPYIVTYEWANKTMTRKAQRIKASGTSWTNDGNEDPPTVIYAEDPLDSTRKASFFADFSFSTFRTSTAEEYPEWERNIPYVTINATLFRAGNFSGLEVRSSGPDGIIGTKDDIIVK
jgi:hypothetical protein